MNDDERILLIRKRVLKILDDCRGYLLPEGNLVDSLMADVMPPPTRAECLREIRWMESKGFILAMNPGLGGPRKWRLTEKGEAEALALQT